MGYQAAAAFWEDIARRPELQNALIGVTCYEDLARQARIGGFDCTAQELDQVFRHIFRARNSLWLKNTRSRGAGPG